MFGVSNAVLYSYCGSAYPITPTSLLSPSRDVRKLCSDPVRIFPYQNLSHHSISPLSCKKINRCSDSCVS